MLDGAVTMEFWGLWLWLLEFNNLHILYGCPNQTLSFFLLLLLFFYSHLACTLVGFNCSVFRDWIVVNDTFLGMYYAMGESCGNINREVQVSISYTLCIWYTIVHSLFIQCPTSVLALCVVSVGLF